MKSRDSRVTSQLDTAEKVMEADIARMLRVSKFDPQSDPFGVNELVTLHDLLDARVHMGHKAGMWNPRIRPYLYGMRNGVHIFNLNTTLTNLRRALNVVAHVAYQNGIILFVNERPQFEALTMQTAIRCKQCFVTSWVPGIVTNSYKLLKTMRTPDLMVFLSVPRSKTAVKESVTYGIPSVGVVDSDCNPNFVLYPVPGNDDSLQAVKLYSDLFCEVAMRGKFLREKHEAEARTEWETRNKNKNQQTAALQDEIRSIYHEKSNLKN